MGFTQKIPKMLRRTLILGGIGAVAGGAVGLAHSQPGLRMEAGKQGIIGGGIVGGAIPWMPKAIKHIYKAEKAYIAPGMKTIFRRIRGRIIPIRVK